MADKDSTTGAASRSEQGYGGRLVLGALFVGLGVFVVVSGVYFLQFHGPAAASQGTWGEFGDYVGGVINPIFGFITVVVLVETLRVQRRDLELSRIELEASTKALKSQSDTLARQNFEDHFFALIQQFNRVRDSVAYFHHRGPAAIEVLYQAGLKGLYDDKTGKSLSPAERAEAAYKLLYDDQHAQLGHYFRTLYHVFAFVYDSTLNDEEQAQYASIARAQLSSWEVNLLLYNCTMEEGKRGFRPLVEWFGLLKHARNDELLDKTHRQMFSHIAFMSYEERQPLLESLPRPKKRIHQHSKSTP